MATTKIWCIKNRLDGLIKYAANPDKTDGNKYTETEIQALHDVMDYASDDYKTEKRLYVSGVNVTPDKARDKMQQTKVQYNETDGIIAFHAIQSFKPGEVTPSVAHEIGRQFAKGMWGDRFEVVIATHLNKSHIHNHFVLNSVSFADGNRYYDTPANYRKMRRISDRLCEEYGLSVIRNPKNKGKHYAEWNAERNGLPTIRGQVREELDEIIKASYTMNEFWRILKERGYVVYRQSEKYKYISFVPPYGTKRIRLDKLGSHYTEDAIRERIISARNGIREFSEVKDYNAWLKKYEPQKLKGFKALYYHYLYLFGRIRKKETPQRVSFYMREELIKLERYQKQFHFLYDNDLETKEQVQAYKSSTENKIMELTHSRSLLYGKPDTKEQIAEINKELRELRKDVRLCNNILDDCERIQERFDKATELEEQAKSENRRKNKSRNCDEYVR